jgi:hypothetical protein
MTRLYEWAVRIHSRRGHNKATVLVNTGTARAPRADASASDGGPRVEASTRHRSRMHVINSSTSSSSGRLILHS